MATADKYDRQLRLWGANGQRSLMNSRILLVNADAVGTETLKNLVLPGVGHITVLDDKVVMPEDLGNNFFVDSASLGRHRAEVVTQLLVEMNSDVSGTALVGTLSGMIATDPNFLSQFNLIVTANVTEEIIVPLAAECWERNIPLLSTRAYGLIGYCRIQAREHNIVESRPDASQPDLRISNPFPELSEYSARFNLSDLDSMQHSHVPWVVLLCQAVSQWKAEHGGALPKTKDEQNAFKDLVKSASLNSESGAGEQNFREALDFFNISQAFSNRKLDEEIVELINQVSSTEFNKAASEYDILVRALGMFMSKSHGDVPLSGMVPDMTSTSEYFVGLQQAYQSKAATDKLQFKAIVSSLLSSVGRNTEDISDESIDIFCKNVFNIRKVTTRSLAEEYATPYTETFADMSCDLFVDPAQTPLLWYLCLRAVDRFRSKTGSFPGAANDASSASLESDSEKVWQEIQGLVRECGQELPMITQDHAREITRYGAGEFHNVAALIGGVVSQEAVKLITHQFVPMDNTFIYNAIAGVGGTYKL